MEVGARVPAWEPGQRLAVGGPKSGPPIRCHRIMIGILVSERQGTDRGSSRLPRGPGRHEALHSRRSVRRNECCYVGDGWVEIGLRLGISGRVVSEFGGGAVENYETRNGVCTCLLW